MVTMGQCFCLRVEGGRRHHPIIQFVPHFTIPPSNAVVKKLAVLRMQRFPSATLPWLFFGCNAFRPQLYHGSQKDMRSSGDVSITPKMGKW